MKLQSPLVWPCLLLALVSVASAADPILGGTPANPPPSATDKTTAAATSAPDPITTDAQTAVSTPPTTAQGTTSQQQPTNTPLTTTPGQTASQQQTSTTPPSTTDPSLGASPPPASASTTDGDVVVTSTLPPTDTSTASAAAATTSQSSGDDSDGGLSSGSIIGMSVAAGIAVLGIIGFFVWKFTRKRFSDFDDNEAIKWPELNAQAGNEGFNNSSQNMGRAGFDTGSEANLSRIDSTSNYSTPDFGTGGQDPYAVPPLPHLNPTQPYRDDPSQSSGFYDPYRGPVPGTIESGTQDWQHEAYPMTQLGGASGRASPAPSAAYGRASPAPQTGYGGRASPGPQAAYGGRASPAPQAAYGRTSPGPQVAYATGPGY